MVGGVNISYGKRDPDRSTRSTKTCRFGKIIIFYFQLALLLPPNREHRADVFVFVGVVFCVVDV